MARKYMVCPFNRNIGPHTMKGSNYTVGCESGHIVGFEGLDQKRSYLDKFCKDVDNWTRCTVAMELMKKYKYYD